MVGSHSKAVLVQSGSYTGVFQSLRNSQSSQRNPSHVSVLCLEFSTPAIQICRFCGQGDAKIPLCFMCVGLFHHYHVSPVTLAGFGFVVCIQRRPVVTSTPSVCVSPCAVCPLCLSSLLLAQSLDRK